MLTSRTKVSVVDFRRVAPPCARLVTTAGARSRTAHTALPDPHTARLGHMGMHPRCLSNDRAGRRPALDTAARRRGATLNALARQPAGAGQQAQRDKEPSCDVSRQTGVLCVHQGAFGRRRGSGFGMRRRACRGSVR